MERDVMDARLAREANVDAILQQVARVLNHRSFARSRSPVRLLRALGERLLLSGRAPATQVDLARALDLPADFDPTANPLVRIHMSKLRRMLARYAEGDGRRDPVILTIPRNDYRLQGLVNGTEEPTMSDGIAASRASRAAGRAIVLVNEFAAAVEGLDGLTRSIAMWLVPQLLDLEGIVAIGPRLREWDGPAGAARALVVRRSRCDFVIEGDCRSGGRGIEIVVRIVDVADGRVCWTDWLDEPPAAGADGHEPLAKLIAARIGNKIGREWMVAGGTPAKGDGRGDPAAESGQPSEAAGTAC